MADVLREHIVAGYCCVYTDDILIFTESGDPAEHMLKFEAVLETLRKNELLVKGAKSELFRREVEFLGFKISAKGWAPTESKIATMMEWPAPETVKHLRSFLGMANFFRSFIPLFFRSFIPLFSEMATPLTDLLKNSTSKKALTWSVEYQESFVHIKQSLTSAQVLCHFNLALRTAVHISASQNAVEVVLLQCQSGEDSPRPVAFMSRKLSGAQYRYDARNVEALAAQMALQTWRTNLLGVQFEIYLDHDSLKYLFPQKEPSQRILRLCKFMTDFNFTQVRCVPGPDNVVQDFLSRPWVEEQGQDRAAIHPLHLLSMAAPVRHTSLHSLRQDPCSSVVALLTWKGSVAVQQRGGACGLWATACQRVTPLC